MTSGKSTQICPESHQNVLFVALNVCGIASKFRYNILTQYIEKFDILACSEIKLFNIPADEFPNFEIFSFKQKSQLHGLSLIARKELFPFSKKILNTKSKCVLWVVFGFSNSDFAFIVGAIYIPGECSKFADKNDFEKICEDIITLKNKYNCPLIILGDMNARSGNLNDFLTISDVDLQFKKEIENIGITTNRFNLDTRINTYGRNLVNMWNDFNLKIVNGRFGNDLGVGNYTCHKPTGESLVDYCLVSDELLCCLSNFYVDTFDRCMSDVHSPICVEIKIAKDVNNTPRISDNNFEKIHFKSSWKPELKEQYKNSFPENEIIELCEKKLNVELSPDPSNLQIEQLISDLTSVILKPAKKLGLCKKVSTKNGKARKSPKQGWFNERCEEKRKTFFKAKNSIRTAKNDTERELYQ